VLIVGLKGSSWPIVVTEVLRILSKQKPFTDKIKTLSKLQRYNMQHWTFTCNIFEIFSFFYLIGDTDIKTNNNVIL